MQIKFFSMSDNLFAWFAFVKTQAMQRKILWSMQTKFLKIVAIGTLGKGKMYLPT